MDAIASPVRRRSRRARARRNRWPRSVAVLLAVVGVVGVAPTAAGAAQGTLTVAIEGSGRVTGTGIDCPGDCSDTESWRDDQPVPRRVLTATPALGFRLEWHGCTPTAGRPHECVVIYDELGTEVTARFVDVSPPTIAFRGESSPDGVLHGPSSPPVRYAVSADDNAGVQRVTFRDGVTLLHTAWAAPWFSPGTMLGARADGVYPIRVSAHDAAGNETAVERTIVYDGTRPVIEAFGPDPRYVRTATATIEWAVRDAHPGSERCVVVPPDPPGGNGTPVACAHPLTVPVPVEGLWQVVLHATDGAGNTAQRSVHMWVDRTPPARPVIAEAPVEGAVVGTRASWVRVAAAPGSNEPLTWWCSANGRAISCPGGVASWTAPAGTTSVRFLASVLDAAGNESAAVERRWTIDEAPPAVAFTEGPDEGAVVSEGDVTIAWSVPDRYGPHSRCNWQDEETTPCAQHRVTRRVTPGEYRLRVNVADDRDLDTTVVRSFTVVAAPDPDPDPGPGPGGDPDPGPGPGGDPGEQPPGSGGSGGTPPGDPGVPPALPGVGTLPKVPTGTPSGGGASAKRCVVPKVKRRSTLKAARTRLTRAGCRVTVKRVRSATVKRGRVVGLSVRAGAKRPHRSTVTVRVSRGRR